MRSGRAVALGTLLLTGAVYAYESLPELTGLTEEEEADFEGPERLGSEYQSDILTYMKPLDWGYTWLAHPIAFEMAAGSTSARHFMVDARFKATASLVPERLEFRFTYLDERHRERESIHAVVELVGWLDRWIGLSLYGQPTLHKRQSDMGAALLLRPQERHEIRIFQTWVDLVRTDRSDRPEAFAPGGSPLARGVVGRWFRAPGSGTSDHVEYALRWETETRWQFLDRQAEYRYWKLLASGRFHLRTEWGFAVAGRVQADRKLEARAPLAPASATLEETWITDRLFALLRAVIPGRGRLEGWELTPGVQVALRRWTVNGQRLDYSDVLPHLWVEIPGPVRSPTISDRWVLGYELTAHRQGGPFEEALGERWDPKPEDARDIVHHRLNTGYRVNFGERASLRMLVTWDLDGSTGGRLWQGGLAQLQVSF